MFYLCKNLLNTEVMKKVLITVLFVCAAVVGYALPNFGAKIGANFSTFTVGKDETKYTFQPGFDIGVFARANFQKLYLQPELVYSYQTSKPKDENAKYTTHNLNIPVLLGYKFVDVKMMNVRAFIGPEFSYVLGESTSNLPAGVEDKNYRAPANIIGNIGVGVDIAMLTIDLRYGYAFNKATKEEGNKEVSFNPHNNVISLSLGWKFL
jgi:hypothetical protein